jgi:GDP-D-mannose dehydratase
MVLPNRQLPLLYSHLYDGSSLNEILRSILQIAINNLGAKSHAGVVLGFVWNKSSIHESTRRGQALVLTQVYREIPIEGSLGVWSPLEKGMSNVEGR